MSGNTVLFIHITTKIELKTVTIQNTDIMQSPTSILQINQPENNTITHEMLKVDAVQ